MPDVFWSACSTVARMEHSPANRLTAAIQQIAEATRNRPKVGHGHEGADDELGTIATDDAIGFNPLPLLRALDGAGARAVVIGQVAGILHGSKELTGDLDLLWSGSLDEADAMCAGFAAVDAQLWDNDDNPVPVTAASFQLPKVEFRSATAAGDCCTPGLPWGGLDIEAFISRAETVIVGDVPVHYLTRPDLIDMRLAVGRPKDLRRVAELRSLSE